MSKGAPIKRYDVYVTSVDSADGEDSTQTETAEQESPTGEWCKYADVEKLLIELAAPLARFLEHRKAMKR